MTKRLVSWVSSANAPTTHFPLNNLPYGVFSTDQRQARCGVAIGDMILDVTGAEEAGLLQLDQPQLFINPSWNAVMKAGSKTWKALRARLIEILEDNSNDRQQAENLLVPMADAHLHMPFEVTEFTDFYAGRHHATNVGTMFRGAENALPPNWLHLPIAYNGRASSVYVSGTDFHRPWGQLKGPDHDRPAFLPSRRFDFELEMGAVIGRPSSGPVSVADADQMIFGYVLLNDWSARDIQAWEYQPLGPFQAKATATTISPWIVTSEALGAFRCDAPAREHELLDHLKDCGPMHYDIELEVLLAPRGKTASSIARTNSRELYYSAAQQLAHHTTAGGPMRVGDLIGSGTISGPKKENRGSLLELSWGGKEPLTLDTGDVRTFLEDGDTLILKGVAIGEDYSIGFGDCVGTVLPALENPFGGN